VRLEERRTVKIVVVLGALGGLAGVLALPGLFLIGTWLRPPLPVAAATVPPPLIREALWARAEGDRANALRPVTPISVVQFAACSGLAEHFGEPAQEAECRRYLPAIQGLEYLSGLHVTDSGVGPSFRWGAAKFATTISLSHTFTKDDFVNTLAARGHFGQGWKGVEAAATGYFGRPAAELDLPQAAFVASQLGDRDADPWCEPDTARTQRRRILQRMRENLAIDETDLQSANASTLELADPPAGHKPCDGARRPSQ
jgi:hypothetical protein